MCVCVCVMKFMSICMPLLLCNSASTSPPLRSPSIHYHFTLTIYALSFHTSPRITSSTFCSLSSASPPLCSALLRSSFIYIIIINFTLASPPLPSAPHLLHHHLYVHLSSSLHPRITSSTLRSPSSASPPLCSALLPSLFIHYYNHLHPRITSSTFCSFLICRIASSMFCSSMSCIIPRRSPLSQPTSPPHHHLLYVLRHLHHSPFMVLMRLRECVLATSVSVFWSQA